MDRREKIARLTMVGVAIVCVVYFFVEDRIARNALNTISSMFSDTSSPRPPAVIDQEPAGSAAASSSLAQIQPPVSDLGLGIKLQLGETKDDFATDHSDAECIVFEGQDGCQIKSPSQGDCPTQQSCNDVVYTFSDGKLSGFVAHYDADTWKSLALAARDKYGIPKEKNIPPIDNMSTHFQGWELPRGMLLFMEYSGAGFQGAPLVNPYAIQFGPSADLNNFMASSTEPPASTPTPPKKPADVQ
jgi:hypothetical protein